MLEVQALVGGRSVETRAVSAPPVVARDAVGAGDAFKAPPAP